MNSYEMKQEARRARYEERAEMATEQSGQLHEQAQKMASVIPFGQPILVGHHSEGRDRSYRESIHNTFGKAFQMADKAKYYAEKAAAVGKGGISSDDPDAIEKLRAKVTSARNAQEKMKAANAIIRKSKSTAEALPSLIAQGFSEESARKLLIPDFCGRLGFPAFELTNNNANIRRMEKRIEEMEKALAAADVEICGAEYTYREDIEENRVMFIFEGKPEAEVRDILKSHSFRWSPSRSAWVRQLTNAGRFAGHCACKQLDALSL